MGLLFNYSKPGPGVPKNEPEGNAFVRFFKIFFRKFWHYVKSNLLYMLFLIPTAVIAFVLVVFMFNNFAGNAFADITDKSVALGFFLFAIIGFNFYISLIGAGPATAGETYVMRNFSQQEHAWVWSDFFDNLKSNFKQSLIVFIVDLLVFFLATVAMVFYGSQTGPARWLKIVVYWIIIIYSIMHLYIYPLMVTFELKLKEIYKNSFLFALGNLLKNLLAVLLLAIIHLGIPIALIMWSGSISIILLLVYFILELCCLQSMSLMLVNFIVFPKIKEVMIDKPNS